MGIGRTPYFTHLINAVFVFQVLASIVFLITSLTEYEQNKQKTNVGAVKPVQLQRLNMKVETNAE